jgi:hypothetical protein
MSATTEAQAWLQELTTRDAGHSLHGHPVAMSFPGGVMRCRAIDC